MMAYNHALVIVAFPQKEFEKLLGYNEIKSISHDTFSFGEIIDTKKYSNYFVLDIEIRKDETPFWYFFDIIKDAMNHDIRISDIGNDTHGKIKTVLVNGENIMNNVFPDDLIIDLIQYKLILKI